MLDKSEFLTTAAAARLLGVSDERTRQLDGALRPERTTTGQRLYNADRVDAVAGERDAAKLARGSR